MAEIEDLDIVDDSNTARVPEGVAAGQVNDGVRALEGILARGFKDAVEGNINSTGSANAYLMAANRTISAYYDGMRQGFHANFANTGPATLDIDSVGAKTIKKNHDVDLASGDIETNQYVEAVYSATDDTFQMLSPTASISIIATGSTTSRSLATRFTDIINVKDYGAKGDGATDDQTAIQAALDVSGPKIVYFPASTTAYMNSGRLFVKSDTTIIGYGATLKALASKPFGTPGLGTLYITDATFLVGISNVVVEGLTIDGNDSARSGGARTEAEIYISASKNVTLRDIRIINPAFDGVTIAGDSTWAGGLSDNIYCENVRVDGAWRNGWSIIGTKSWALVYCQGSNTSGTAPNAGLDIEPNDADSPVSDGLILGGRYNGNTTDGILSQTNFTKRILLNGVEASDNTGTGFNIAQTNQAGDGDWVRLQSCTGTNNTGGLFGGLAYDIANAHLKFWADIDVTAGVPTLDASIGISSIGDNAVGDYRLNFSPTLKGDYAVATSAESTTAFITQHENKLVGSVDIRVFDTSGVAADNSVSVIGTGYL